MSFTIFLFRKVRVYHHPKLGGGFQTFFICTPTSGNDPMFQMGWFNHQPEKEPIIFVIGEEDFQELHPVRMKKRSMGHGGPKENLTHFF